MKMSPLDKFLFMIYTLLIALLTISVLGVFLAIAINVIPLMEVKYALQTMELGWKFFLISGSVLIIFLVLSIKLFFVGVKPRASSSTLIKHTELGIIQVSINALEAMAQKAISDFEEVKDMRISISNDIDGISIRLKILVMPDVILPELSVAIQEKVKSYIENHSGVTVKEVLVYIDTLPKPQVKTRVQ